MRLCFPCVYKGWARVPMCEITLACVCDTHWKEKGLVGDVVAGEGLSRGPARAQAPDRQPQAMCLPLGTPLPNCLACPLRMTPVPPSGYSCVAACLGENGLFSFQSIFL